VDQKQLREFDSAQLQYHHSQHPVSVTVTTSQSHCSIATAASTVVQLVYQFMLIINMPRITYLSFKLYSPSLNSLQNINKNLAAILDNHIQILSSYMLATTCKYLLHT